MKKNLNTKTTDKDTILYIHKGSLFFLIERGRITTQISGAGPVEERPKEYSECYEPVPARWFVLLEGESSRISVGREKGAIYLTEVGWNENLSKIKEICEATGTFDKLQRHAKSVFKWRAKKTKDFIEQLKNKINQAKNTEI